MTIAFVFVGYGLGLGYSGLGNPFSAFSSPDSDYPVGQDASVYPYGGAPQETKEEPTTWSQQNSDSKAAGGVYSNVGSNMNGGDSGWAKNGGVDSGSDSYYPVPEGYPEELIPSMDDEEEEEEEPVLSDVSDLDPVYRFSSRSRYQNGRQAFFLTRYNPGEPMVGSDDMSYSNGNGMGNGKGWPDVSGQPGKGGY